MFQYFMRSLGRTDLILGSLILERFNQSFGMGRRWLKFVCHGFVVVAVNTVFRVKYLRDIA
jgi:hypothetical protein